ncbi:hypothetical protein ACFWJH_13365 [Streptomyces lasiicapitis]|uniref:hypothetical protein n=1 Tax=Streptomyces lasiicapitis TaxID=1923961 RepID=UPI00365DAA12
MASASRGILHRTCPAQCGEGRFAAQAVGVVSDGDQQTGGAVRADPGHGKQLGVMPLDQLPEAPLQFPGLQGELLDALSQ